MPGLYDMPDMGTDYDGLAKIAAPQMMPNAPIGAGGMAGQMYYQDKSRQDQMIQRAGQLAELQAQMKGQQAEEYSRAAPGRQANIDVGNATAQGSLANIGDTLTKQKNDARTGAMKSEEDKYNAEAAKLNRYANDWNSAPDKKTKQQILSQMRDQGVDKIGNRTIDEVMDDPEQLDPIMKMMRGRQENTPAQAQKMDIEKQKGTNRIENSIVNGEYSLARKAMDAEIKKSAFKWKSEYEKQKPETMSQWEASNWKKLQAGEMNDLEREGFIKFQADRIVTQAAAQANKSPTVNPGAINPPNGPAIINPPTTPGIRPIPKQVNAPIKTKDGWEVKGLKAMKDGEEVTIVGENDKGQYQLSDGRIIGGK